MRKVILFLILFLSVTVIYSQECCCKREISKEQFSIKNLTVEEKLQLYLKWQSEIKNRDSLYTKDTPKLNGYNKVLMMKWHKYDSLHFLYLSRRITEIKKSLKVKNKNSYEVKSK